MKKLFSLGVMIFFVGALIGYLLWDAPLLVKLIPLGVGCAVCSVLVVAACMLSSEVTQDQERKTGRMEQEDYSKDEWVFTQSGWMPK